MKEDIKSILELNVEYTYKDICNKEEWTYQTANNDTKKKQIKEIEDSFEFFHPMNKKTHKPKKSYVFTAKKKKLNLTDNRGKNCKFSEEEFDFLFDFFIHTVDDKMIKELVDTMQIHFSNYASYQSFGWDISQYKTECEDRKVYNLFLQIVGQTLKQKVITKITKEYGELHRVGFWNSDRQKPEEKMVLRKSITYHSKDNNRKNSIVIDSNLLPLYKIYEEESLKEMGYKDIGACANAGKYDELNLRINDKFEKDRDVTKDEQKFNIRKVNYIIYDKYDYYNEGNFIEKDINYDNTVMYHQLKFKIMILEVIKNSIENRCNGTKNYKHDIVKTDKQKEQLRNLYMQLENQINLESEKEFIRIFEEEQNNADN